MRAGLLSSPAPRGSQEPQPSGSCPRSHRRPSVHHLVHHHHHHHHHYHLGNGTLRVPRASPQIQDKDANGSRRLMLPPPSTLALSRGPPGGAESVHSFYHADCHLEPVRCQAPPPRSPSEASGRTVGSGKVYPTMHTSPPPEMLKEKALMEVAPTSGPPTLTSLNIPPRPYSSMHKLLETQSIPFLPRLIVANFSWTLTYRSRLIIKCLLPLMGRGAGQLRKASGRPAFCPSSASPWLCG